MPRSRYWRFEAWKREKEGWPRWGVRGSRSSGCWSIRDMAKLAFDIRDTPETVRIPRSPLVVALICCVHDCGRAAHTIMSGDALCFEHYEERPKP